MVSRVYPVGIQASGQHGLHTGFPRAEWGKDFKGLPLSPLLGGSPAWLPAGSQLCVTAQVGALTMGQRTTRGD